MRGLGILLALLLALAASACGGSEPAAQQPPQDVVALAASKTNDAGTYKVDTTSSIEVAGQTFEMSGTGAFDGESQRGHTSFTASIAGQNFDMEAVYALPAVYLRYPPGLVAGVSEEKPWVKLDLDQLGQETGLDLAQVVQTGQPNPSQGLRFLNGFTDTQTVGTEDVRGVETTHYKGVVDLRRLAEEDPSLKGTLDQLAAQTGVTLMPVEVWIDGANLVRRMRQSFEGAQMDAGVQVDMTTTTELYDFGTTVNVEEPPSDQVVDFQDVLGQS